MTLDIVATGSGGNCYLLAAGRDTLMLDCGVSYKRIQNALGYDASRVTGCLVTHEHNDHTRALGDLARAGIDCYMTRGTADAKGVSGHRIHPVTAGRAFTAGRFTAYPFQTEHDAAEPVGFLLSYEPTGERLLYATDTFFLRYAFKGVHYFMVECNYCKGIASTRYLNGELAKPLYDRLLASHFSLDHLKDFFRACDLTAARQIILVHLSDGNSDERRMVREIQSVTGVATAAAAAGQRHELTLTPF
ncbi:MAG: MBL fold metallo-hydrolase [Oscillospiraceae bacterium]|jgi:phosphoribosyl 1,2-cyclic phosphodiesterase|nr:MBL fold metallo-hydrolase [Oscillospiraceae bacterium]